MTDWPVVNEVGSTYAARCEEAGTSRACPMRPGQLRERALLAGVLRGPSVLVSDSPTERAPTTYNYEPVGPVMLWSPCPAAGLPCWTLSQWVPRALRTGYRRRATGDIAGGGLRVSWRCKLPLPLLAAVPQSLPQQRRGPLHHDELWTNFRRNNHSCPTPESPGCGTEIARICLRCASAAARAFGPEEINMPRIGGGSMCTVLDTSHTIPPTQEADSAPCLLVCVPNRRVSCIGGADGEAVRPFAPSTPCASPYMCLPHGRQVSPDLPKSVPHSFGDS